MMLYDGFPLLRERQISGMRIVSPAHVGVHKNVEEST